MLIHDGTTTRPALLLGVRDWGNEPAWHDFFRRYDGLLYRWCLAPSVDAAAADEIRENVWIELSRRMRTFQYDPRKSFRGWLRDLCRCRTVDYLRKRQRESQHVRSLEDSDIDGLVGCYAPPGTMPEEAETSDPVFANLLHEAEEVQAAVRRRVKPQTWDVFWEIGIEDQPIGKVAAKFGLTYAAAFAAFSRARQILREEGERRRGGLPGA